MIKTNVFNRIVEFYGRLENDKQIGFFNSLLKKAMNFKEIIESQDKVELGLHLKRYLETGMVMRDKKYLEVKELMKMLGE